MKYFTILPFIKYHDKMKLYKGFLFLIFLVSINFFSFGQGLEINELMSTNRGTIYDEDGDTPDWLEIKNGTESAINLSSYYLSDNGENLLKWQFPEITLEPQQILRMFASDKDRRQQPLYWNTIINLGDSCKFTVPESPIATNWITADYDDSDWDSGTSGIGYGDGDDNTLVASNTISVFMRFRFDLENPENIEKLWFHMDYDDGFVAYLNGVEIAREGLGSSGTAVAYNQTASSHEAVIYKGKEPARYDISAFADRLKPTGNILSIQVHNTSANSSDLTGIPFLTIGTPVPVDGAIKTDYFTIPELFPHTNFKLSSKGETLYLSTAEGIVTDLITFGTIPSGFSYGRNYNNPNSWCFYETPTPGLPNSGNFFIEILNKEVVFSPSDMFISSEIQMVLSGADEDEEIRFTLDGSTPDENSMRYTAPVTINSNTPVRARVMKPGAIPGKIVSHTYVFDPPPTLPVVSVVTDPDNLWDNENGIYVLGDDYTDKIPYLGANFWEDWEKPAGIEMVETDGSQLFSLNCGLKIFGGWSRAYPQKSLAVFFRGEYGDPVLDNVQLFDTKNIDKFYSLVLRNGGNDYGYTRLRDGFMTNLVKDMNITLAAFKPVILYLNGQYWGHINLREKLNEDFLESNTGVDADAVDLLERNGTILEGSNEKYFELINFLESADMSLQASYETVSNLMDIENFIDYELSEIYFDNRDWPGNNVKFWRPQTEEGKWRWIMYDTDFGFGLYNSTAYHLNTLDFATVTNGPNWPNPPWSTLILRKLLENEKFKIDFINRFADMMNTTFLSKNVVDKIDSITDIIHPEINRHSERWQEPAEWFWSESLEDMRVFAYNRSSYMRSFIREKFNLPAYHTAIISVEPAETGKINLNTISVGGATWKGQYFQDIPIKLEANALEGYTFINWKVDGNAKTIIFSEINYKSPDDADAGDWVEIYNYGNNEIDISGWIFKDNKDNHSFVIPENTYIASHAYLVFCRNTEDFVAVHPDVTEFLGDFDFGLGSSGDAARLFSNTGELVDEVVFNAESPWVTDPNGNGPTLEFQYLTANNSEPGNWLASTVPSGTPGRQNSVVTSVKEPVTGSNRKQLNAYPNPFSEIVLITWENVGNTPSEVCIYSIDGRKLFSRNVLSTELRWNGETDQHQPLAPGIYICKVSTGGKVFTKKLILQKGR